MEFELFGRKYNLGKDRPVPNVHVPRKDTFQEIKERIKEDIEAEAPPQRKPHVRLGALEYQTRILAYLKSREGQPTSVQNIADNVGLSNPYTSQLTTKLLEKRAIVRKGKQGRHVYAVKSASVRKARQKYIPKMEAETIILDWIAKHPDEKTSLIKLKGELGVPDASIQRHIVRLMKEGRIVRTHSNRDGTAYRVVGESPNPPEEDTKSLAVQALGQMVMEFISEKRSTNVLEFLEWVEQQNKEQ